MSNIRRRTSPTSTLGVSILSILSILLMVLLASISGLNIPSFSQEENNGDDTSLILSGRINSMLMPTMADKNNDVMDNSMFMPQIMNNGSTAATDNNSAASRAMQFSMARDVAWLLSGGWVLVSNSNDSGNSTTFDAEFIKVTTNGTMLHT